jgi:Flp pilus assembly protein TadD
MEGGRERPEEHSVGGSLRVLIANLVHPGVSDRALRLGVLRPMPLTLFRIIRRRVLGAIVILALFHVSITAAHQDTPSALAERMAEGVAALKADRADEALLQFRAAAAIDPSHGPARLLAGTALLALARVREARVELEQAVRLMPREVLAHTQLAEACQRLGDEACAVAEYRRVVQLAPDDPEFAYRLGSAYLSLSQWAHERITRLHPNSARLHQALGREYLHQGQTELALRALTQAASADPTLPDIHLALARIHLDEGRLDDAAREIQRELALVPFSKDALELHARIQDARRNR